MDGRFLAFITVSGLLIMAPGPDMALVARNALRSGWGCARATALGVCMGILGWGVASMLGIAALLAQSAVAFTAVKVIGAMYLLYLGWHSVRAGIAPSRREVELPEAAPSGAWQPAFMQGVLGNLLNPKAAVIFVSVVPQFTRHGDSSIRLGLMLGCFELMLVGWLTLYGYLVCRAGRSSAGMRLRRGMQTISGLVLMGFAVRLATERR